LYSITTQGGDDTRVKNVPDLSELLTEALGEALGPTRKTIMFVGCGRAEEQIELKKKYAFFKNVRFVLLDVNPYGSSGREKGPLQEELEDLGCEVHFGVDATAYAYPDVGAVDVVYCTAQCGRLFWYQLLLQLDKKGVDFQTVILEKKYGVEVCLEVIKNLNATATLTTSGNTTLQMVVLRKNLLLCRDSLITKREKEAERALHDLLRCAFLVCWTPTLREWDLKIDNGWEDTPRIIMNTLTDYRTWKLLKDEDSIQKAVDDLVKKCSTAGVLSVSAQTLEKHRSNPNDNEEKEVVSSFDTLIFVYAWYLLSHIWSDQNKNVEFTKCFSLSFDDLKKKTETNTQRKKKTTTNKLRTVVDDIVVGNDDTAVIDTDEATPPVTRGDCFSALAEDLSAFFSPHFEGLNGSPPDRALIHAVTTMISSLLKVPIPIPNLGKPLVLLVGFSVPSELELSPASNPIDGSWYDLHRSRDYASSQECDFFCQGMQNAGFVEQDRYINMSSRSDKLIFNKIIYTAIIMGGTFQQIVIDYNRMPIGYSEQITAKARMDIYAMALAEGGLVYVPRYFPSGTKTGQKNFKDSVKIMFSSWPLLAKSLLTVVKIISLQEYPLYISDKNNNWAKIKNPNDYCVLVMKRNGTKCKNLMPSITNVGNI
jgi:DNA-binding XRE family transcriptional regulator